MNLEKTRISSRRERLVRSRKLEGRTDKSKFQVEVVLTVEEATGIAMCDPDVIAKLDTFLIHLGVKKKETSDA